MQKNIRTFVVTLFFLGIILWWFDASAQRFGDEINAFVKSDSQSPPQEHAILFVGSSSFRFWTDVQDYFPGYTIINRGFGGSTLPDVIQYADKIIYPYHPKQVVIYCGENDFAESDTVTAAIVAERFKTLFNLIRQHLPSTAIAFISAKPSPSRKKLMPAINQANTEIKKFLTSQKNTAFIDVYHKMLDKTGEPLAGIFKEDQLHMNAKGYAIWKQAILPFLIK